MKTLSIILLSMPNFIHAQEECRGTNNGFIFQANRIGTFYFPQGEKFFDLTNAFFKVPYTSEKSPSTIFASSPWIGGYIQGDLKFAGQTYMHSRNQDFNIGPLGPHSEVLDVCNYFDRVWTADREDIIKHINDFNTDGIIDDTMAAVFSWPAQGNKFFPEFNGFELPLNHYGGWGEFADLNHNGKYEPEAGEYPQIKLQNNGYIPEKIMWMVFNDQVIHESTKGQPLGIEIQFTVFGFNCMESSVLNNTLFNTYKIINQNDLPIDSLYFGLWADYDLGCFTDDYIGADSSRNTEFVYNQDQTDGNVGSDCTTNKPTYGAFPPIQSLTYLSHPMHSFISAADSISTPPDSELSPIEYYNLLRGLWPGGSAMTAYESGYNPGGQFPITKFLYHGDPRDSSQWAQSNLVETIGDPRTVSSVYLDALHSHDSVVIETAYQFHQDSALNNLEQVGFMQENIDYLLENLENISIECSPYPVCREPDCVWPGDFNHNGVSDHFDLLYWGAMKDLVGNKRNGLINWDGYLANNWSLDLPDGFNAKHGDGNGNGMVNSEDLDRNIHHFLFTNELYAPQNLYPVGPEIVLSSSSIDSMGRIRDFRIKSGLFIENVLGIAYEIEFDTSIFSHNTYLTSWPSDSNFLIYKLEEYTGANGFLSPELRYSAVQTDHKGISIQPNFTFQRILGNGFLLKPGLTIDDIPDSTIIRLRNLIAIDPLGNDLHIGSHKLVVYKQHLTGITELEKVDIPIYPNPARDFLFVEVPFDIPGAIFNVQGQILDRLVISPSNPIDVSGYSPGVYYLRLPKLETTLKVVIY